MGMIGLGVSAYGGRTCLAVAVGSADSGRKISTKARAILPLLASSGARVTELTFLGGVFILKLERARIAAQVRISASALFVTGSGIRMVATFGPVTPTHN